jgi:parallel beta-helix repeat protein
MSEAQVTRGIVVDAGANVRVVDNVVRGTSSNGIRVEGGSGVIVTGNTVRAGSTNGITFFGDSHEATFNVICDNAAVGIRALDTRDLILEHNSFLNQGSFGVELAGDSVGTVFRSNAVVNSSGPGLTSVTEDPSTSHNMFFANGGSFGGAASGDPTDRGDTDPLFVDRSNCDVTLMPGSPAIGAAHDGGNVGAR